jgi:hypothetical protein
MRWKRRSIPAESLRLDFEVHFEPRGFTNRGIDASVVANGSYFANDEWLPAIGYEADRELRNASDRYAHGLAARPEIPCLDDDRARHDAERAARIMLEAVVGTDEGQVAIAPGRLRRMWTENGRRYFHYATDAPIRNDYAFFSAAYAVHERPWNPSTRVARSGQGVSIQIFHHPNHAWNADRMAHQWWGNTLIPADVEGAAVLTETLAWYSAMGVVEQAFGREHLQRLLSMMREVYVTPRARADVPLLRAGDWFLAYRKGPFAMCALRGYIGAERVNATLRRLLEKHGAGRVPLPTSLDLYRELQAVTPESLRYLLVDLFEANTFWELATQRVTAEQTERGDWRVTLDVQARKVVVDTVGVETEVPMDDLVEVGVFTRAESEVLGESLYLQMHRIHSGQQRITVTVPSQPARAGIDPRRFF